MTTKIVTLGGLSTKKAIRDFLNQNYQTFYFSEDVRVYTARVSEQGHKLEFWENSDSADVAMCFFDSHSSLIELEKLLSVFLKTCPSASVILKRLEICQTPEKVIQAFVEKYNVQKYIC